jgi:hypothetical protein
MFPLVKALMDPIGNKTERAGIRRYCRVKEGHTKRSPHTSFPSSFQHVHSPVGRGCRCQFRSESSWAYCVYSYLEPTSISYVVEVWEGHTVIDDLLALSLGVILLSAPSYDMLDDVPPA